MSAQLETVDDTEEIQYLIDDQGERTLPRYQEDYFVLLDKRVIESSAFWGFSLNHALIAHKMADPAIMDGTDWECEFRLTPNAKEQATVMYNSRGEAFVFVTENQGTCSRVIVTKAIPTPE